MSKKSLFFQEKTLLFFTKKSYFFYKKKLLSFLKKSYFFLQKKVLLAPSNCIHCIHHPLCISQCSKLTNFSAGSKKTQTLVKYYVFFSGENYRQHQKTYWGLLLSVSPGIHSIVCIQNSCIAIANIGNNVHIEIHGEIKK